MMNTTKIDIKPDMSVMVHNSMPVVTTEQLAWFYGSDVIRIQQNHARNSSRFVSGKHFFKISGKELKNLRLSFSESQISSKARSLILWTERGAARHAKMLETDQAWDVFEKLEDCYFNKKQAVTQLITSSQEHECFSVFQRSDYQDGRDAVDRLRTMALSSLSGNARELALRDCREAEEALISGWTEIDEAMLRFATGFSMLRRWRDSRKKLQTR